MDLFAALFISLSLAALMLILFLAVRWARSRSRGAVAFGALLTLFAPDPTLENQIRLVEQAKQEESEEDEEGEPK